MQPYTVAAGWASLIGVFVVLTRYGRLDHVRSFVISGSLPIGAVGVFEAIYQSLVGWTWTVAQSEGYHPLLLLVAWSLPGFVGVAWWRITRLWIALLALTGAGFVGWFAVGMAPPTTFIGFAFNVPLKIAVFVLLSLPIVERCVPRIERLFPKTGKHPSERCPSDGS